MPGLYNENTRQQFNQYLKDQATLNKMEVTYVQNGGKFSYTPEVERNWLANIKADDEFLNSIDMGTCITQVLDSLGLSPIGLISSTTNTKDGTKERKTTDLGGVNGVEYIARRVNYDVHLRFDDLDEWAYNAAKFQLSIQDKRIQRRRMDIISIGWNGIKWMENSDKATNPLGEDVNRGWLQCYRDEAPERIIDKGEAGAALTIGKGGTYRSVDHAVAQIKRMIPRQFRKDLRVYISDELVMARHHKVIEHATLTELENGTVEILEYKIAGLKAYTPDSFPEGTIAVIPPKNLAHRTQKGSIRSSYKVKDELDRIENYNTANEVYGIHEFRAGFILEKIELIEAETE